MNSTTHEAAGVMIFLIHFSVLYHPVPMFEVQSDMKLYIYIYIYVCVCISYNTGKSALPDIYTYLPSGIMRIYQAKHSLCYNT